MEKLEDISMNDASMSAESNDGFMDMANLSDCFTGNTLNMLCWQGNTFLSCV